MKYYKYWMICQNISKGTGSTSAGISEQVNDFFQNSCTTFEGRLRSILLLGILYQSDDDDDDDDDELFLWYS